MYTAGYTLAGDGHVGGSRVRNPAPRYVMSRFMSSFLYVYTAVYTLAADGQVRVGFSVGW